VTGAKEPNLTPGVVTRGLSLARRAVAYAQRRRREAVPLVRGKLILHRYSTHYRRAMRRYAGATGMAAVRSVYDVGVVAIRPGERGLIQCPADFSARVATVARGAAAALDCSANCDFFPALAPDSIGPRTGEVAAVARGEVISIKLRDPFALEGLQDLCEPLLEELERAVYCSHVIVDKVYVYRSPVSRQSPKASWLWHFDNHPREMLKVMVYLTDVDRDSAPFEYLADANGRPKLGAPLAPLHSDSRVPAAQIERDLAAGWTSEVVTGPAGTVLVFDDNVVHRGTLARARHRDVVVFQVRPATFRATPRLDPRWTGSFGHLDFNPDPHQVAPTPRAPKPAASA
jgi:hypothetical protein